MSRCLYTDQISARSNQYSGTVRRFLAKIFWQPDWRTQLKNYSRLRVYSGGDGYANTTRFPFRHWYIVKGNFVIFSQLNQSCLKVSLRPSQSAAHWLQTFPLATLEKQFEKYIKTHKYFNEESHISNNIQCFHVIYLYLYRIFKSFGVAFIFKCFKYYITLI